MIYQMYCCPPHHQPHYHNFQPPPWWVTQGKCTGELYHGTHPSRLASIAECNLQGSIKATSVSSFKMHGCVVPTTSLTTSFKVALAHPAASGGQSQGNGFLPAHNSCITFRCVIVCRLPTSAPRPANSTPPIVSSCSVYICRPGASDSRR